MTLAPTAPAATEPAANRYIGALDGLRAIAVAAVVIFHFAPSSLPGGFLGVDVFFVVSGFLIARLLVAEIARTGSFSRPRFWARRARRLLPAVAVMTVVVLVISAVKLTPVELHDLRAQALGTLFYVANWVFIGQQGSYFALAGRPSPFLHMWSLAIEEQFYLALPLVFFVFRRALVRRPVRAAVIAMVAALGSTIWMAVLVKPLGDPSRAYLGTGSHAMGLLVGVALGVLAGAGGPWDAIRVRLHSTRRAQAATSVIGIVSLVVICVTMKLTSDHSYRLFRGGFLVFSLVCGLLIAVVVLNPKLGVTRALSLSALVAFGLRSYSLYLWHWPVRVFLTPRSGLNGPELFLARVAISLVLAELSYRFVERPFRTGVVARRSGSRGAIAFFGGLTGVAGVLVVTIAAPTDIRTPTLAAPAAHPNAAASAAPQVDIFGDSTALVFGYNGTRHGKELGGLTVRGDADLGCGLVDHHHVSDGRIVLQPAWCKGWPQRWKAIIARDHTATLALMTGAWEVLDHRVHGQTVKFGTPAWTTLVTDSLRQGVHVLADSGRTVYVFQVPCYGVGDPQFPLTERSDPKRIDAVNAIFAQMAREMPNVKIVPWRDLVCPGGHRVEKIDGKQLWEPDDAHLTAPGALAVWRWWLPQLAHATG
jgi:peptidoglycan/LPS O-acetylase OafA/YrhL